MGPRLAGPQAWMRVAFVVVVGMAGTFEDQDHAPFLSGLGKSPRDYSEDTARAIDAEIRQFLDRAHARVLETLTARRTALETLAKLLIDHEVVDGEQLSRLVPASH